VPRADADAAHERYALGPSREKNRRETETWKLTVTIPAIAEITYFMMLVQSLIGHPGFVVLHDTAQALRPCQIRSVCTATRILLVLPRIPGQERPRVASRVSDLSTKLPPGIIRSVGPRRGSLMRQNDGSSRLHVVLHLPFAARRSISRGAV
jgi:hypothetical protein